jgi:putative flippase GtrA
MAVQIALQPDGVCILQKNRLFQWGTPPFPFFNIFPNAIPYTAAWAAAVLFAYWASKYFVFIHAEQTKGSAQFFRFVYSRVFTLLLCLLTEFVFVTLLSVNELIVKYAICTVLNIVINYITSKLLVFKKKKED